MALLSAAPLSHIALQAASGDSGGDPFESISNFFSSGTWSLIVFMVKAFLVIFWLALVWWTYQDARRRSDNMGFVVFATALSLLLPFLGTLIYLVVRPPEYLLDARERELELIALERRLGDIGDHEGQEIVGRILGRDTPGSGAATKAALRDAGVATRDELQDLEIRLTELEYRLRRGAGAIDASTPGVRSARRPASSATSPSDSPAARPPENDDADPRTTIRRMRRNVRPDPEASS